MSLTKPSKTFRAFFKELGSEMFPHQDDHQGCTPCPINFKLCFISDNEEEAVSYIIPAHESFRTEDAFFQFVYEKMEKQSFFYLHEDGSTCVGVIEGNLQKGKLEKNCRKLSSVRLRPTYSTHHPTTNKPYNTNEKNVKK